MNSFITVLYGIQRRIKQFLASRSWSFTFNSCETHLLILILAIWKMNNQIKTPGKFWRTGLTHQMNIRTWIHPFHAWIFLKRNFQMLKFQRYHSLAQSRGRFQTQKQKFVVSFHIFIYLLWYPILNKYCK